MTGTELRARVETRISFKGLKCLCVNEIMRKIGRNDGIKAN